MAKTKSFSSEDIVLECEGFSVTAGNFGCINFEGVKIKSGESYYVSKAVKLGAKKQAKSDK